LRVLLVSQHYAPEVTAATARVQAFAEGLAARDHRVSVICEVPSHPRGVIAEGYRSRGETRQLNGVDVRYVWTRARPEKTTANRLLFYGTFAASAVAAGIRAERPDVVLVSSPPLPAASAARLIARRHRVPWVFDVRDLWPEAAVVLGELRGAAPIRAAERLERSLYRGARRIVTVTEPFRRHIAAHLDDPGKLEVIPNGTTSLWLEAGRREPDRAGAGLPKDEFVWAYGGNLGIAQGLESAIEAASLLGEGYRLLVIGEGPRRDVLRALAEDRPNAGVEFRPLMEPADAAATLRACDALLVPLAARPELAKFVPSKLFDSCALARPVILAAEGEPRRLAGESDAALEVPPEDPEALAAAVRRLREDPELARGLSDRGREFAEANRRERGVERLESVLEAATAR
jgi:colanic acid biosynthesis glycosyl transferase WcaI